MSNPLFNLLSGSLPQQGNNQMMSMINQFIQFKNSFQGNPEEKVKELMNSGKMTQEQFNNLSQIAKQFESFFPK